MVDRYVGVKPFTFNGEAPDVVRHESGLYLARVVVLGRLGLHAIPSMDFVERSTIYAQNNGTKIRVARLDSSGRIYRGDYVCDDEGHVDGTSIMQMMMLAAARGTHLGISFTGNGNLNQESRRIRYFLKKLRPSFMEGL